MNVAVTAVTWPLTWDESREPLDARPASNVGSRFVDITSKVGARVLTHQCDRGVPECFHCVRSGWKCDGYPPQVQFHAETFNIRESGSQSSPSSPRKSPSPSRSKSSSAPVIGPSLTASHTTFGSDLKVSETNGVDAKSQAPQQLRVSADKNSGQVQGVSGLSNPSIQPALSLSQNVAASKFSAEHLSPSIPMRLQLCFFGSYIRFIPPRIGHNQALDLAVSCLSQAHSMRLQAQPSADAVVRGNRTYGIALQVLQKSINDASTAFEPEILCTAELLATYEVRPPHS
jgi:hypothetical protein